jgi:hypothetical protein
MKNRNLINPKNQGSDNYNIKYRMGKELEADE